MVTGFNGNHNLNVTLKATFSAFYDSHGKRWGDAIVLDTTQSNLFSEHNFFLQVKDWVKCCRWRAQLLYYRNIRQSPLRSAYETQYLILPQPFLKASSMVYLSSYGEENAESSRSFSLVVRKFTYFYQNLFFWDFWGSWHQTFLNKKLA